MKPSSSAAAWVRMCRLGKRSSGATLPSMSVKLSTRPGCGRPAAGRSGRPSSGPPGGTGRCRPGRAWPARPRPGTGSRCQAVRAPGLATAGCIRSAEGSKAARSKSLRAMAITAGPAGPAAGSRPGTAAGIRRQPVPARRTRPCGPRQQLVRRALDETAAHLPPRLTRLCRRLAGGTVAVKGTAG